MDLSVVLPALNGRDRLATSLGALAEHTSDVEVVVVNGPSADGTTGMVRERDSVDVPVEISDRNLSVTRNTGLEVAGDDAVALLRYDLSVESPWLSAFEAGIADGDAVTEPIHQMSRNGMTTEPFERNAIGGRTVTYFNGGNVAFRHGAIDTLGGFDEYLQTDGAHNTAHRLAGFDRSVAWAPEMCVRREFETDGGVSEHDWGWKYHSLAYRFVENYGIRPGAVKQMATYAVSGSVDAALGVLRDDVAPSGWVGSIRDVVGGIAMGVPDRSIARTRDRTRTWNPHGRLRHAGRAVTQYDRR